MTPEQLRKALAKGTVAPAYFLCGPETGRKKGALDALATLVPEASRAFNVQIFHAFEADFAEMLTAARTLPFMGPRRLVVLRDIEKARLDQGGRAALFEGYLAAPAPETVFVVTTEDDAKAKSLGRQFEGRWVQVEFRALQGVALSQALRQEAERLALRFAGGAAAEALLAATGADLARARNELAKLRAALGEGGGVRLGGSDQQRIPDLRLAIRLEETLQVSHVHPSTPGRVVVHHPQQPPQPAAA